MHSLEGKGKPEPLIVIRNQSRVSIVESRATWLKNARSQDVAGSSVVDRILDALEHLGLWPPLDQLHSMHWVDGILHSLVMWPGFPQLKQAIGFLLQLGVLAFPFPLVNASISTSDSSSDAASNALMSIALGSLCQDGPAIPRKWVNCLF